MGLYYKGKNVHNIVKFFIDFTENNEIVFKYAKRNESFMGQKIIKKDLMVVQVVIGDGLCLC